MSENIGRRLAKLLPLLHSDKPGEVAAAAAAMVRVLHADAKTFHDLAAFVASWTAADPPPDRDAGRPLWQLDAECALKHGGAALTPKEADFLRNMIRCPRCPSKSQRAWLDCLTREYCGVAGTPATTYLARRRVDLGQLPGDIHRVLRWHPACPWEATRHGAIIALFSDIVTGEPRAIHRIAVTASGDKIGKKMLGPAGGCVIRLWADNSVTAGLVLGEGIETTLAAATRNEHRGTRLTPAWAAASAGAMGKFPVLAGVEALTLLVDNDASGTGQEAATECSARWTAAGREVSRLTPNETGHDFADITEDAR